MTKYLAKFEFIEVYDGIHNANNFVVYRRVIDAEDKDKARIEARRIKDSLSDDHTSHISTSLDKITEEEAIEFEESRAKGQKSLIEAINKSLS